MDIYKMDFLRYTVSMSAKTERHGHGIEEDSHPSANSERNRIAAKQPEREKGHGIYGLFHRGIPQKVYEEKTAGESIVTVLRIAT